MAAVVVVVVLVVVGLFVNNKSSGRGRSGSRDR